MGPKKNEYEISNQTYTQNVLEFVLQNLCQQCLLPFDYDTKTDLSVSVSLRNLSNVAIKSFFFTIQFNSIQFITKITLKTWKIPSSVHQRLKWLHLYIYIDRGEIWGWPGPNFLVLLSTKIYLAWNSSLDKNRNALNQISTWFSGQANNSWIPVRKQNATNGNFVGIKSCFYQGRNFMLSKLLCLANCDQGLTRHRGN